MIHPSLEAAALERERQSLTSTWSERRGMVGWFCCVDHKTIGVRWLVTAFAFFTLGGIEAALMRLQLARAENHVLTPDLYNQIFSMHGTTMMFLFAVPVMLGLGIYFVPLMVGARSIALPRLVAFGYWMFLFGGIFLYVMFLLNVGPDAGWFNYPPLSGPEWGIGKRSDVWAQFITFSETSALTIAVALICTILKLRAPGMALNRMPIFVWAMLVVAIMIVFAMPAVMVASTCLILDRLVGTHFFNHAEGGDPLLWQHLFWLFGHPEVYIIFLPAAAAVSTILPVMARTTLLGYGWVVAAAASLGVLSFGLWVHHMFATGIPHMGLAFFSAASTLVAVPTGVQVFAWIGTLWKGRPELHLPMLWILAFFATFVMGGLTGVMIAMVPFDWQSHDTYFIVAHFHYVLVGGFVFPMLAAVYYWLPHFTGRKRFFRLGETAFWLVVVGFHGTFLLLHWAGLLGMRRRIDHIDAGSGWELINLLASISGFVMAVGFALVLIDVGVNAAVAVRGRRNPWRAGTLEWAMPSPSPSYNLASIPEVRSRYPLHDDPELPVRIARGEGYLGDPPASGRREILSVEIASGRPSHLVIFPTNSALPIVLALVAGGFFVGMLAKAFWLVPLSGLGVAALGLWWAWTLGSRRDLDPEPVGNGLVLPFASEAVSPPGWWGSLFLLLADGVFFGSLLFGYAFLWTVAPNWPPPAYLEPGTFGPASALGGVLLAVAAIRLADRALRRGGGPVPGLVLSLAGLAALAAAAVTVLARTDPQAHAYDATLWVLGGYVLLHAGIAVLMTVFLAVRARAGYLSARRLGEVRVARLWTDYAVTTALLGLGAAWLPGALP